MLRSLQKPFLGFTLGIVLLIGVVSSVEMQAAISVSQYQSGKSVGPRGSEVLMLEFRVDATGSDESIHNILFKNTATNVQFGNGIDGAKLYVDNGNTSFDEGDQLVQELVFDGVLSSTSFSSSGQGNLSLPQDITSGNNAVFFITYDVSSTAALEGVGGSSDPTTMNIHLTEVRSSGGTVDLSTTSNKNFHRAYISGISTFETEDVSPTIVIPGDTFVPMLKIKLKAQGEEVTEGNDDIQITIKNDAANFVTSETSRNGITRVHLYTDQYEGDAFTPTTDLTAGDILLQTLNITDFESSSFVTFRSPFEQTVSINGQASERRFYVVYDIGEDFVIDSETKVQAQVTAFSGQGRQSGLPLTATNTPKPNDPYEAYVAGLTFDDLHSIVPSPSVFGSGTRVPILGFSLFAYHTDVTVNTIILQNTGTVDFITQPDGADGINRIRLFEDTNGDGEFDGVDSSDTKIGDLVLGNGNQSSRALIPIEIGADDEGLNVPSYSDDLRGYPRTNEKKIFVVYDTGQTLVESTDADGNYSNAIIENIIGSSNFQTETVTMNALGNLPATAVPTAQVVFGDTNIYIVDSEDISPTFAVRGQVKVPMVYLTLNASFDDGESVSSASVTILNENQTFKGDHTGVSKVWIYRDEDEDKELDGTDTLLSAKRVNKESDLRFIDLNSVPFSNGEHNLMILYDIGQESTTVTDAIRCKISGIESNESSAIRLGGEVPTPKESATLTVTKNRLSVDLEGIGGVTAIAGDLRSTFNFRMTVENISPEDIALTEIRPAFYADSESGIDISAEFNYTISSIIQLPITINSGQSQVVNFASNHHKPETQGSAILDVFAEYAVDYSDDFQEQRAQITRYEGQGNFQSAADQIIQLTLTQPQSEKYGWDFPSYIQNVEVDFGGTTVTFNHGNAVQEASNLLITLRNKGEGLDESSIEIFLNQERLVRRSTSGALLDGSYSYDVSTGVIRIKDLGDSDGTLTLDVQDMQGNTLEQTSLEFKINPTVVSISDLLVYPSPFIIGSEPLLIGYNLTRDVSVVSVYIYNYLGRLVHTIENTSEVSLGYNMIEINAFEGFLKSGMYVVRVIAEDRSISNEDERSDYATTRFAVY